MPVVKSKRVLLVVLNKSVVEKFNDSFVSSEYELETVGSVAMCEEEFTAPAATSLPIAALIVPPTASEQQRGQLTELASKYGVGFAVSIPRNALEAVQSSLKK